MYAKVLLPDVGTGTMRSFIIATAPEGADIIDVLEGRGWARSTGNPPSVDGRVIITPDSLTVMSGNDAVLTDHANPLGPDGWWKSVDVYGSRVVVWIVPTWVDLGSGDKLAGQLVDLIDRRVGVWADLPIIN